MIPLKKDYRSLAEIRSKLPRYCTVRERKAGFYAVYFQVPDHMRPEGWKRAYLLGTTNKDTLGTIIQKGKEKYQELLNARLGKDAKPRVTKGSLGHVIELYKKSERWENIAPETQKKYDQMLTVIFDWSEASNHPHISLLTPPTLSAFLNRWKGKQRTRKHYKVLISNIYHTAIENGFVSKNITKEIKLPVVKKAKKKLYVWSLEDIERFIDVAIDNGKPNIARAVAIAWEAFRQTDVFNFQEPRDYKDGYFKFDTSKTGERVAVKASQRTQSLINKRPKTQMLLTVNDYSGKVWTKNAFYNQFKPIAIKAGLPKHNFKQIRNSAAIHALKADLTNAEFKQRFGWSQKQVEKMVDLYTDTDRDIIDSGADKIHKLEEAMRK